MRRAAWLAPFALVASACSFVLPVDDLSSGVISDSGVAPGAGDAREQDATSPVEAGTLDAGIPDGASVWSGNGHAYLFVATAEPISWPAAQAAASSAGGHLVTTTSIEEHGFVSGLLAGPAWLGARQDPSGGANEPDKNWGWVTGELWGFTHWRTGEPNESSEREDYAAYFDSDFWNDVDEVGGSKISAYVVEFE